MPAYKFVVTIKSTYIFPIIDISTLLLAFIPQWAINKNISFQYHVFSAYK